eukprot:CAMPEP_0115182242 /NCGR_PEP_ID=MMETSP0270-20121206/7843_1 /TAXON_ID=71861 /ORGANISM="Scrippsiella trochoidea, Strain CCMP3099" /LENGTH=520 /DNA_ID=CAMNT_0002595285 /DNA_START=116 /DNA_END=1678 /DNA_ORIENTATION=-
MMLTLWSIIAVELLHPVNVRIAERGYYGDCDRCERAYSSVFAAILTFLQQIIAGDSWGLTSLPIIEEEPATFIIFFAVLITVNLGLLNLILTVIVDVAHTAREEDDTRKINEKAREFEAAKVKLLHLCEELDSNKSGELCYEELLNGMETNPRFSTTLASMDVSPDDMHIIFSMLDEDSSGTISYSEFVEQLHKLKSQDTHTMLIFIRGFLKDVRTKLIEHMHTTKSEIGVRTEGLVRDVKKVLYGSCLPLESALNIKIEGARGLRTDEAVGASDPYCCCEIAGKPDTKTKSHLVEDSLNPDWQFEDVIEGFALGDSLTFTVLVRDSCQDEYCLGTAVLPTEQIVKDTTGFEGELQLHHSGEHEAFLTVKVSSVALNSSPAGVRSIKRTSASGASLCSIEGRLERLVHQLKDELIEATPSTKAVGDASSSRMEDEIREWTQRVEDELVRLREDMAKKTDEQIGILQSCSFAPQTLHLGSAQKPSGQEQALATEEPLRDLGRWGGDMEGRGLSNPTKLSRV